MDAYDRGRMALDHLQHIENCYKVDDNKIIIEDMTEEAFEEFLEFTFEVMKKYVRGRRWYED